MLHKGPEHKSDIFSTYSGRPGQFAQIRDDKHRNWNVRTIDKIYARSQFTKQYIGAAPAHLLLVNKSPFMIRPNSLQTALRRNVPFSSHVVEIRNMDNRTWSSKCTFMAPVIPRFHNLLIDAPVATTVTLKSSFVDSNTLLISTAIEYQSLSECLRNLIKLIATIIYNCVNIV